jgi:hypothetical protein
VTEVKMIDDQIRQIAVDRREEGWRPWDTQERNRLKSKFITRPDKPAARFERLRMTRTRLPRRDQ